MPKLKELAAGLRGGEYDGALERLYPGAGSGAARRRAEHVAEQFQTAFSPAPEAEAGLFSGPGRTEIGGNHTDHQRGHVLCGSVDLDMLACAAPNGRGEIRVLSEGYAPFSVALDSLAPDPSEYGTTAALVRGVAAGVAEAGYTPAGFDAFVSSNVLSGSGLSSSAAFEILIGTILNRFCCGVALDSVELAKIGQRAENLYFGKPCGLMDQAGCAVGGAIAIDFEDPTAPRVRKVRFDFQSCGHALCIVDTRSDHADLTGDYAAIPAEMGAVAAYFGKNVLREVPEAQFRAAIPALRRRCGDRAVLRALHFYDDDRRAQAEAEALEQGDFPRFLSLVNASGLSSSLHLQNIWSPARPERQAVALSLALGRELLGGAGAIRVHGGGFAGTIQAFVPEDILPRFKTGMEALLGEGSCHVLRIRPEGGCAVI